MDEWMNRVNKGRSTFTHIEAYLYIKKQYQLIENMKTVHAQCPLCTMHGVDCGSPSRTSTKSVNILIFYTKRCLPTNLSTDNTIHFILSTQVFFLLLIQGAQKRGNSECQILNNV